MNNPYAAPQHPPEPAPNRVRFFTPLAIGIHTALVPWIGATLAAINFRRLKNTSATLRAVFLYVLPSMVIHLMTIGSYSRPLAIVFRGVAVGLGVLLYREQRNAVGAQLASGEAAPARWYFFWLGLIMPLFFVFLLVWQFLAPTQH